MNTCVRCKCDEEQHKLNSFNKRSRCTNCWCGRFSKVRIDYRLKVKK